MKLNILARVCLAAVLSTAIWGPWHALSGARNILGVGGCVVVWVVMFFIALFSLGGEQDKGGSR